MKADISVPNLRCRYTESEVDMAFDRLSINEAKSFLHFLSTYRWHGFALGVSDDAYPMKYQAYRYARYGEKPAMASDGLVWLIVTFFAVAAIGVLISIAVQVSQ